MTASAAEQSLLALWDEIASLEAASAVLQWDQETGLPPKGRAARGAALATLAGLRHRLVTAPALADAIARCAEEAAPGSTLAAQVRLARHQVDRAARVPEALARALAEATSAALVSWQEARQAAGFARFRPDLERVVALRREQAAAIDPARPAYDVLIDEFEPGATEAALAPLFADLRARLAPLIQEVAACGRTIDESPARGRFPAEAQRAFGVAVAERMGYDFAAGRLDRAAHPFCTSFGPGDVRITWRFQEDDFRPALFGIMHEAGHGLYEQGLPAAWERQPIGAAVSLGVHESQSRLWENLVGRSRAFWRWALPAFRAHFPDCTARSVDALWPALHTVKPSFIRVEADEATYNLHVAARFEIERQLFGGGLEVGELPGAWDDAYEDLLGIRPRNQAEGVLQDIHWAMGSFGYFPTYTLGNLIASQLYEAAAAALGPLDPLLERGELRPLRDWLREQVHAQGSRWTAAELVERVTGRPPEAAAFLRHLGRVAGEAYGVRLAAV